MQPEKIIENSIFDFLRTIGCFAFKVNTTGQYDAKISGFRKAGKNTILGTSDIIAILNGRMICIEVKSKLGKLTDHQRVFLRQAQESGAIAFVARSVDDVANELIKHLKSDEKNLRLIKFIKEFVSSRGMDH